MEVSLRFVDVVLLVSRLLKIRVIYDYLISVAESPSLPNTENENAPF